MPLDRRVEFVAVDEIQLCADPDRGHVFTSRLLHARGLVETMFLGAETIRPLLQRLVPQAEVETRPRLSQLTYAGPAKLMRLPQRSAIVAFSATEVYAIAESDPAPARRLRGGDGPACLPARAMHRWPSTRTARWISWSPPTRSAWA